MSPPTNASTTAANRERSEAGAAASMAGTGPGGALAPATKVPTNGTSIVATAPRSPSSTKPLPDRNTPATRLKSGANCVAAGSVSVKLPLASRAMICLPDGSMRPSSWGKKCSVPGSVAPGGGVSVNATFEPMACAVTCHPCSGVGSAARSAAIALPHCGYGSEWLATGNSMSRSALSGMQTSLHTSQSARAASFIGVPMTASRGTVRPVSSRTSPSYPKLTSGPVGNAWGAGHWIAPTPKPSGSFQVSVVGRPESPGLRQYVCQPSAILSRSASVIGLPGMSAVRSGTSSACTCSVLTVAPMAEPAKPKAIAASSARERRHRTEVGTIFKGESGRSIVSTLVRGHRVGSPERYNYRPARPLRASLPSDGL